MSTNHPTDTNERNDDALFVVKVSAGGQAMASSGIGHLESMKKISDDILNLGQLMGTSSEVTTLSLGLGKEAVKGITTLSQDIQEMKKTFLEENDKYQISMRENTRNQKLEWAIANYGIISATFVHFWYLPKAGAHAQRTETREYTILITAILLSFRQGFGHNINGIRFYGSTEGDYMQGTTEVLEQLFRNKLSEHIHLLTGVKPNFSKDASNEKWIISYGK
eukprot:CAMPEP_0172423260 /NCGR_PEP_ID=MMETSP1064-20121228/14644_1 /TAXON_ID=202472 /ORGANISM="Aulacoseira subarctica , Strain CCAP 1002/5" /LENGTH=221 /DNA_ID=CAMNT_0013164527 /DNA_START=121 /DNA_END=786 /DNA_ORIENTATION=+